MTIDAAERERLNSERLAYAATRDERRKERIAKAAGLSVEEAEALGLGPKLHPECKHPMFVCIGCHQEFCTEDASGQDDGRCVVCAAGL